MIRKPAGVAARGLMRPPGQTMRRPITTPPAFDAAAPSSSPPRYLTRYYWWAYVHPRAVRFFERQWLVNLILWGNFRKLRDAALDALGRTLPGRSLQVACVYGDLSRHLLDRVRRGRGRLDVVDVLPVQLANLARKLPDREGLTLHHADASALPMADAAFDRALLFFLLHEQPPDIRRATLREAWRVVRPGGRLVLLDYARPAWWNPLRYLWLPLLRRLEPFAPDLWRHDITALLPADWAGARLERRSYFGGLYQLLTVER